MSDLIDPDYREYLVEEATDGFPPRHSLSTAGARELMEAPDVASPHVRASRDVRIPTDGGDIGLRVYVPDGEPPYPVLVYYHGGGWVRGDLAVVDAKCRAMCNKSGALIVSVDYRLAPEHPFPAAVHDAIAAMRWVDAYIDTIHGDPDRIAVSGMSAGGNLAAVVSLWARDHSEISIKHQLLLNPVTDYDPDNDSYSTYSRSFWTEHCPPGAGGYPLSTEDMAWYWSRYLRSELDAEHPYAVPLKAPDLTGMPPTTVVTSELDPLRGEGHAYARRLTDAGVPVEYTECEGVFHSFLALWWKLDRANAVLDDLADRLATSLSTE